VNRIAACNAAAASSSVASFVPVAIAATGVSPADFPVEQPTKFELSHQPQNCDGA
jgi:hypothetical protein